MFGDAVMVKALSATMTECLDLALENGGELVRYQGGFWAARNAVRASHDGIPRPYHGARTIEALLARGHGEYSEWREGRNYRFPIAVKLHAEPSL